MSRSSWHEIPPAVLREHGEPDQVDRVWARIERDLPARGPRRERSRSPWAAPVLGLCLFGAGVVVGARFFSAPLPVASVAAEPGPFAARVVVPGAVAAREREPSDVSEPPSRAAPIRSAPKDRVLRHRVAPPPAVLVSPGEVEEPAELPAPAAPAQPPPWLALADEGRYAEALEAVEGQGGFDAVLSEATAEQLMLLVDVARATGQRERAILALRRVVNQHGADPNAPLAAWMLGNELGRAGDADGASQAFAMYRALSPQGDFAQDALARQFEVAAERQDLEQAQKLADQYARDFPDGPRREDIFVQLEELRALLAEAAVASTTDGAELGAAGGRGGAGERSVGEPAPPEESSE